ncbi:MAG: hypothetical protein JW852_12455 [Spirochaetales bacterium]|nr:hypothetical protein [Spirochaetales bacterium]
MNGFSCDVRAHGTHQIEIKTRYPISAKRDLKYDLDLYFFSPGQLQLDARRYGVQKFFEDLKANTRYTTPGIPLSRLIDESFELSPLNRINRILDGIGTGGRFKPEKLLYEIRTLVNIYKAELRDTRRVIQLEVAAVYNPEVLLARIIEHVTLIDTFLSRLRATMSRFIDPHIPEQLRAAIEWADESISIATEVERLKLFQVVDPHNALRPAAERLKPSLDREAAYRRKAGYSSVVNPSDQRNNEDLLYREGILKKWAQSAMYMSSEQSRSVSQAGHIIAGVAAAVAMSFAVAATFLAGRLFVSYSIPWALLIVVSYIFKDRLKEVLRSILIRLVPRLIADDADVLTDPAVNKKVGSTRSSAAFRKSRDVSARIRELRNLSQNPFRDILPEEDVIHYRRRIRINGKILQMNHQRLESITDILRLKLDSWMEEMDNPENFLTYFEDDRIKRVVAARVYHANVVVALAHGIDVNYYRFRLILTRNGLIRVETVTERIRA